MTFTRLVSTYSKKIGIFVMFILPMVIIGLLAVGNFDVESSITVVAAIIWVILLLNSAILSLNGILLSMEFSGEIKKKTREGFPVESLEGFTEIKRSVSMTLASTIFITVAIFASLSTFLIATYVIPEFSDIDVDEARQIMIFAAIGLALVGIGITLMLKLPEKPAIEPGALMGHFTPTRVPSQIDNLLGDTVVPFLDPITRMRWDEFQAFLEKSLKDDFLPNEDLQTRLEVALEKVLLFVYLCQRMPDAADEAVCHKELGEIVREDRLEGIFTGEESGINWVILTEIIQKVKKEAPEIFEVIDRVLLDLRENLRVFQDQDLWVTVGSPTTISGTQKPFRILVFALNLDSSYREKKRPMLFKLTSQAENPPFTYNLHLDESEELGIGKINNLPFTAEDGPDVVGVLSQILRIGDAVWFQVHRTRFGKHVFQITCEDPERGALYGSSMTISVVRDLMFYVRTYGGKVSALAGVALPFGRVMLSQFGI